MIPFLMSVLGVAAGLLGTVVVLWIIAQILFWLAVLCGWLKYE